MKIFTFGLLALGCNVIGEDLLNNREKVTFYKYPHLYAYNKEKVIKMNLNQNKTKRQIEVKVTFGNIMNKKGVRK